VRSQIKLGRIGGIEIGLHYSWFIIAFLIALSLADHFRSVRPEWGTAAVWTAAVITAVLFFVTLLMHELAHSLMAKSRGLRVRAITLFALGGVSQIESEAPNARSEFWIAIVGPLTSLVLGFLFLGIARGAGWQAGIEPSNPVIAVLLWLGYINIVLAAFNMIPGYPLDGGRVLRAIIWWITGSPQRSTRAVSLIGQGVALLFILFGLFRFFLGAGIGGLWTAFVGWFLLDAARSSYVQFSLMAGLRGRRVADLMEHDCLRVPGYVSVRDFVDEYLLHSASRCFLVLQDQKIAGLVTPDEVKRVGRDDWSQTSLQSIMQPFDKVPQVPPDMPAVEALELLARDNINQVAVVAQGKLEGIFSRGQVARFFQVQSDSVRR